MLKNIFAFSQQLTMEFYKRRLKSWCANDYISSEEISCPTERSKSLISK